MRIGEHPTVTLDPSDQQRLVGFFYLLMRDHVSTGVIPTILDQLDKGDAPPYAYSAPELEALAQRYADRATTQA